MPTKKWIDKKNATNYQLRHRAQTDPLIHDDQASDLVFTQVTAPNASRSTPSATSPSKIKTTTDLAQELSLPPTSLRKNEGEAAMHGVYYDDTEYDYMQHMRDINDEQVYFIGVREKSSQGQNKKKNKMKLEDALRLPQEMLPSEVEVKRSYQDMQDVPDALSGFQPDMDPRLREVLEALEDEAYVEDDEDVFGELAKGDEISPGEFAEEGEEDGWESDVTEKPPNNTTPAGQEGKEREEEDWHRAFKTFKNDQKKKKGGKVTFDNDSLADTMSFGGTSATSSFGGTMSVSSRSRRRRKKAGTESSGYSMSSSALYRTEGLTLLDDRFDKVDRSKKNTRRKKREVTWGQILASPCQRLDGIWIRCWMNSWRDTLLGRKVGFGAGNMGPEWSSWTRLGGDWGLRG
ncbi:unnamed protein product [Tuber aestivum]|uniref:Low temperature viability protein n=1 Tax=Tuber aestivum TaxID=59557 RepID=A0A292PUZ4_9PEZI|nr:unnamed protein product [Tuber aestivum]